MKHVYKTALVVEGGGMRGIYTAGILELFMQQQFDPFDLYIGVSAGSCNLSNYIAKDQDKNPWTYRVPMMQDEFINLKRFLRGGHLFDIEWLLHENQRVRPIDVEKANSNLLSSGKEFRMVVSNVDTGKPEYLAPTKENWLDCLHASCAIPFFYKNFCRVDGKHYVDGGLADPIPVKEAYVRGARIIVVLRTRDVQQRKRWGSYQFFGRYCFRKNPALVSAVNEYPKRYMDAIDFIHHPPAEVKILQLAPPAALVIRTSTRSMAALDRLYAQGLEDGLKCIDELEQLLNDNEGSMPVRLHQESL